MNRVLHARVPHAVLWLLTGLLLAGGVGSCELAYRPKSGIRVVSLQSEARSELPAGSSRERVQAWLEGRSLPYEPVYDKSGKSFLWYLVRMPNGSWMRPDAILRMTFYFKGTERLSEISASED